MSCLHTTLWYYITDLLMLEVLEVKQSEVSTVWLSVQLWEIYHSVLNMVSVDSSWKERLTWSLCVMTLTVVNPIMFYELYMHVITNRI